MAEKKIYGRIAQKHDVEKNWLKATKFIPMKGELIVYDRDDNVEDEDLKGTYSYERLKVGDGVTLVSALPFVDDAVREYFESKIKDIEGNVSGLDKLVGGTAVSEQISTAIDETTADDFGVYVQDAEPAEAIDGDIWVDTANDPSYIVPNVPEVTEADNGKILMVVNGTWQAVTLNMSVDADGVLSV